MWLNLGQLTSITPLDMTEMVLELLPSMVSMRIFLYRALIHFPAWAEFPIFTMFHSDCLILRPSLTKCHYFMHDILQKLGHLQFPFKSYIPEWEFTSMASITIAETPTKILIFTCSKLFIGVVKINLFNIFDQFKSDCAWPMWNTAVLTDGYGCCQH